MPLLNVLTTTKEKDPNGHPIVVVITNRCMVCNEYGVVEVPELAWNRYQQHSEMFIQDSLRELSDGKREQMMSGIHDACFDILYPPDKEDL